MRLAARLPRRDALAIAASLGGVTLLAWLHLVRMAQDMSSPEALCMAAMQIHQWTGGYFWMMFWMWAVMMVGMMVPSVAPMVLIYAGVARKAAREGRPMASAHGFVAGYLVVWIGFSLLATIAQWQLDRFALLSPLLVSKSPLLGAAILLLAGTYQQLPVKHRCLTHCRGPIQFMAEHWKSGAAGAFRMGLEHGVFCLGCCWVLMLLLFVGGVMNLLWVAAITLFVLLEKVMPFGEAGGRMAGLLMIAAGGALAALG
jgi:predicted metal-binding membrane protein